MTTMEDKLNITVKIAGESFKLRIQREYEYRYRESAKNVEAWVKNYVDKYPDLPMEQLLRMIMFQFAYSIEKIRCTCKYCGYDIFDFDELVLSDCPNHPNGSFAGKHVSLYIPTPVPSCLDENKEE